MIQEVKQHLWRQFGASIDMLQNAIVACPDDLLVTNRRFFFTVYHTLIFLDLYLTNPPKDFSSPLPYTLQEDANIPRGALDDVVPDRQYSKAELLGYLRVCREKCRAVISGLTEDLSERWIEDDGTGRPRTFVMFELLLYNMRHVQHHTAQLNMMLRKDIDFAPNWISFAKDDLN
jgi:hypothetical protein